MTEAPTCRFCGEDIVQDEHGVWHHASDDVVHLAAPKSLLTDAQRCRRCRQLHAEIRAALRTLDVQRATRGRASTEELERRRAMLADHRQATGHRGDA